MKKRRALFSALMCAILTLTACSCGYQGGNNTDSTNPVSKNSAVVFSDVEQKFEKTNVIEIKVKKYGKIKVELYGKVAPLTVANFLKLVNSKFYDGLTFHRIISGFMIQGGDPNGDGTGGSGTTVKGEFAQNGVVNNIKHNRGVISMARSTMFNSASSQFFIMHKDSPSLNGQYAAFGKVTEGMDVVDKIAESAKVQDDNGSVAKADQPVIESIREVK